MLDVNYFIRKNSVIKVEDLVEKIKAMCIEGNKVKL